jgi:hypothetical protein
LSPVPAQEALRRAGRIFAGGRGRWREIAGWGNLRPVLRLRLSVGIRVVVVFRVLVLPLRLIVWIRAGVFCVLVL